MQVIINMTFDVVMATSAVSDMTEGFGCYSRDLDEIENINLEFIAPCTASRQT